ncbi:hypothetical protein CN692_20005 [Bacillus sp. AFS002410]|uniref:hypothetical protein n=1 Tax=Bacillus sp. AFS002410 TaxID=2033481 RepID=UPI000BF0033A|nr:hypothetical protein [Bacillus sp. AFS002410]PEJ54383.1 hypothetical protein CN692_20005 [Bacillus sp. AFS002410]
MDAELFESALKLKEELVKSETISEATQRFFTKYQIPIDILLFMSKFSFSKNLIFDHVYFDKVNDIPDNNLWEENKRCIDEGLLIIGSGLNGDFIVVDLQTLKVGYVFHDEIWEDEDAIVRENYINLNWSIGQFYYNALTMQEFPVDGFQAEEYMEQM